MVLITKKRKFLSRLSEFIFEGHVKNLNKLGFCRMSTIERKKVNVTVELLRDYPPLRYDVLCGQLCTCACVYVISVCVTVLL